jgi:hypothetical protein
LTIPSTLARRSNRICSVKYCCSQSSSGRRHFGEAISFLNACRISASDFNPKRKLDQTQFLTQIEPRTTRKLPPFLGRRWPEVRIWEVGVPEVASGWLTASQSLIDRRRKWRFGLSFGASEGHNSHITCASASILPEQFLAVGWVGDRLYSIIFEVREAIRLYEENS